MHYTKISINYLGPKASMQCNQEVQSDAQAFLR